jgi:hypothetical protein
MVLIPWGERSILRKQVYMIIIHGGDPVKRRERLELCTDEDLCPRVSKGNVLKIKRN